MQICCSRFRGEKIHDMVLAPSLALGIRRYLCLLLAYVRLGVNHSLPRHSKNVDSKFTNLYELESRPVGDRWIEMVTLPLMSSARWLIVDVETDGLCDPIHIVELAAQLMNGWEPVGNPFRMLVNQNVPIPAEAVAIHGYTQECLARHGANPTDVYASFKDYARDYPIVAHNLCYDWNRCLLPEWSRLGISQIGQRGFCCMMLARRLVWESRSYRLDVLKSCFGLTQNQSHRGS